MFLCMRSATSAPLVSWKSSLQPPFVVCQRTSLCRNLYASYDQPEMEECWQTRRSCKRHELSLKKFFWLISPSQILYLCIPCIPILFGSVSWDLTPFYWQSQALSRLECQRNSGWFSGFLRAHASFLSLMLGVVRVVMWSDVMFKGPGIFWIVKTSQMPCIEASRVFTTPLVSFDAAMKGWTRCKEIELEEVQQLLVWYVEGSSKDGSPWCDKAKTCSNYCELQVEVVVVLSCCCCCCCCCFKLLLLLF